MWLLVYWMQVPVLKYIQNTEWLGIMLTKVLALVIVRLLDTLYIVCNDCDIQNKLPVWDVQCA